MPSSISTATLVPSSEGPALVGLNETGLSETDLSGNIIFLYNKI